MKTTHLGLQERERTLAGMRASQLGISVTEYVAHLIQKDANAAGLSQYLDATEKEVGHAR